MSLLSQFKSRWRPAVASQAAPLAPLTVLEPPSQLTGLRDSVLSGWFNQDTKELFTGFPVGQGDIVADIGCGLGGHAQFCARQGARVLLVDADPRRVEQAAARIAALTDHAPFECYVSDSSPLPIADGGATKVVCSEVLEHVDSPAMLLAEIARIGSGGTLSAGLSRPAFRSTSAAHCSAGLFRKAASFMCGLSSTTNLPATWKMPAW